MDYTAKLVVGEKNGETYYDHALTEIEKTALIDGRDEISSSFTTDEAVNSVGKDKRLFSILQANSSKVVDENGEPLVVYHGTREDFTVFDLGKALSGRAFWFADRNAQEYNLVEYCGQGMEDLRLMPLFANIKNPAEGIEVSDATDDQDGGFVVVDPQKYDQGTLDELKDELGERYDEFVNGGKIATAGFVLSPNQLKMT